MRANQIFYNFLSLVRPNLAKAFKKIKGGYETYPKLQKAGHKFFYDLNNQVITHIFYRPTFNGYEYGKELAKEVYKIVMLDNGFKIKKEI